MRTPQTGVQLDRLGLRILQRLAVQGRTSYSDLGRELKLSVNTVRDRILAMERRGLIRGYQAVVDEARVGNRVHALCFIHPRKDARPLEDLGPPLQRHLRAAHRASGRHAMVMELAAPSMEHLQETLQDVLAPAGYPADRIVLLGNRLDRLHVRTEVQEA